jgi:3-methyladenine DNA glycosylase AlkD
MTAGEIVDELKGLGHASYKATMFKHGAREPFFGVKIEDMKKIVKRVKKDYQLALDLYATGIGDAMYLAGLIADDARMTKKNLNDWAAKAAYPLLSEYTVPWVAAGSPVGHEVALEWIESKKENVASSGWTTLSCLVALKEDADLDMAELKQLLQRIQKTIHEQPNRVRYAMNGFLIAVGCYVAGLTELALQTTAKIGPVSVEMGATACKVPDAVEAIKKVQERGTIGKKRKTVKC